MFKIGRVGMVWMAQDTRLRHPTINGTVIPLTAYGVDKQTCLDNYAALFQDQLLSKLQN